MITHQLHPNSHSPPLAATDATNAATAPHLRLCHMLQPQLLNHLLNADLRQQARI